MKRPLFALCLAIVLGVILYLRIHPPTVITYGETVGEEVCLSGLVYAKEYQKGLNGPVLVLYLKPEELRFRNQNIPFYNNFICVLQSEADAPVIGSRVVVTGILYEYEAATNPGQFDAKQYYRILGFSAKLANCRIEFVSGECNVLKEKLWQFRCSLGDIIETVFEADAEAFFKSMLLGDKSALDIENKELYKEAGILHILAISGLHISFLGMGFYKILRKIYVPAVPAAVISGMVMLFYGIMVGLPVSAFRAICMFLIRLLANCTGCTYDMPTALALCAAGMLLENPLYLYNAGFLLSFCAMAGVCILKPALLRTDKEPGRFEDALATSLSVALITLPVQLCFYYEVSVYSVFWNLFVIPLAGYCMGSGVLAITLAGIVPALTQIAQLPALCATGIFWFYEAGSSIVSKLPGNLWRPGKPEMWQLVLYAVVIGVVLVLKELQPRYKLGLFCGVILCLGVEIRTGAEITFLDVGQGDCICIQLPDGSNWLCDGGSSDVSKVGEYRIEPFLKHEGITVLDAVFLSHGDSDHTNGVIELLLRDCVTIRLLVLPCSEYETTANSEFREVLYLAREKDIPILWLEAGMEWRAGETVATCLHPAREYAGEDSNADSEVIYITYQGFSFLLTGDVGMSEEQALFAEMDAKGIEAVTILKVPHHGSRYSCSEGFLERIQPKISVISCGEHNRYGHPHVETLERLADADCVVLTTPEWGAIKVELQENGVKILPFRQNEK